MNALANSQLEELDKFVGNVPGAPRSLRALHRPGERRGAKAHRGRPAGHPPDQLHDARAPDDPAGRSRPARHRKTARGCASSSSTSCTPTAGARAPTWPCSCAACASGFAPSTSSASAPPPPWRARVLWRTRAGWSRGSPPSSFRSQSRKATSSSRPWSGHRSVGERVSVAPSSAPPSTPASLRHHRRRLTAHPLASGSRRARHHRSEVDQRWVRARPDADEAA
jgi:hypothetical protein